jgi:heme/copper-type cytochrome/quinol oxidase subunit 2
MPYDTSSAGGILAAISGVTIIIFLAIAVFFVFIYWRIASKAGYPGAMSLLLFIPIANLIIILIFAFSEWPIQKELNQLRAMAGRGGPVGPGPGGQFPSSPQYPGYGQPQQFGQPGQPPQFGQPQYPQPGQPQQYPQR